MSIKKKFIAFGAIALFWLVLDRASKAHFEFYFSLGEKSDSFLGLFQFRLVHNTGAAWGIFADATFLLALVACGVCLGIFVLVYVCRNRLSSGEVIAAAFVFAGGLGNAIDRFFSGYVVDFIEFTFIEFPVFNIADIGVTCGIALFLLCYLVRTRKEIRALKSKKDVG